MEKTEAEPERFGVYVPNPKLQLLAQVREVARLKHYSLRTEETYVQWIRRIIFFHGKRYLREMGAVEIEAFLPDLAVKRNVRLAQIPELASYHSCANPSHASTGGGL